MKERDINPDMSEADRLAAAMDYARAKLTKGRAYELVFQISPRTGKKLTRGQIFAEVDFDKLWGTDFSEHLSEDDLERTYLNIGRDVEAERVVIDEAIKYLHEPGLKLRTDRIEVIITELIIGILEDRRRRSSAKRGGNADVNSLRDRHIVKVIEGVCEYGFKPTKNREPAKPRHSGCSIVTEVLANGGLKIKEQAVEKIWQKIRRDDLV
jgi:hypothetical protein